MPFELVEPRVDFAIVQCLRSFTYRFEQQRFWIKLRVNSKDIHHNPWRGSIVPTTDDVTVADNEDQFAFVVVFEGSKRIDSTPQ